MDLHILNSACQAPSVISLLSIMLTFSCLNQGLNRTRASFVRSGYRLLASKSRFIHHVHLFIHLEVVLRKPIVRCGMVFDELVEAAVMHQAPSKHTIQQMDSISHIRAELLPNAPFLAQEEKRKEQAAPICNYCEERVTFPRG